MLPFSFMEIFFFLSLGITFVLILLIVYHFKQRITTMEHKSDTMFDIVQNLAKEVSSMKTQQASAHLHSNPSATEFGRGMFMPPIFMHQAATGPMGFQMSECENLDGDLEPVVEELDCEDETDCESEDSDDEDDESDSDDESIIFTGEDVDVELCEIEQCAGGHQIDNNICIMPDREENFQKIKVEDDISPVVTQEVDVVLGAEVPEPRISRQETLVEEELPVPESENPSVPQETPDESVVTASSAQDDYKKMSTPELKKLVASKGNAPKEINKLKRQDLLKLLEKPV